MSRSRLPGMAMAASLVAFLMAAGTAISAFAGQIFLLPFALIPLTAGIGILRRRAWSAWGFALYTVGQSLPVARVLLRSSSFATTPPGAIGAVILAIILTPLLLIAGRSLARQEASRALTRKGRAWPWVAVTLLTTVPVFVVQAFVIPTGTMEDTLLAGDRILVQRLPKPSPTRGDMVVFVYPIDRRQTFVKRVIGVSGDHIRISNKVVYRNGSPLDEPYAVHKTDYLDPYRDNFPGQPDVRVADAALEMLKTQVVNGEVVVPEGKYFVLGDNRDLSLDSRYWGFLSSGDLIGRPLIIYDSEEPAQSESASGTSTARPGIRWNRLFKVL